MKYLLLILTIILMNCTSNKKIYKTTFSLKNDINQSIIDGFFDGDTTKINKDTYFLK